MNNSIDINIELGKGKRFTVVPPELEFRYDIVLLNDFEYWSEHYEELNDWCDFYLLVIEGMTIEFKRKEDLMMFILRWS
jgi:hypothetical protein